MQRNDGLRQLVAAYGVVEDRLDPLKLGRVRVRWYGFHTEDKNKMPTESLPWAMVSMPPDSKGHVTGLKERDWVLGLFLDGPMAQQPVVLGRIHGIPETISDPQLGFNDPTPDEILLPEELPRPPFMGTNPDELTIGGDSSEDSGLEGIETETGTTKDPNKLPAEGTAFGVLTKDFRIDRFPYDVTKDGAYNWDDAEILTKQIQDALKITRAGFEVEDSEVPTYPMSRYPLEPLLKKPDTNAFELGIEDAKEHLQFQIISEKKGEAVVGTVAEHESAAIGTDEESVGEPILEPDHGYRARYPFNSSIYTESGHLVSLDDTPEAERIEIVHRSGTFKEIHPEGTEVNKVKKNKYQFVIDNYLAYSGKNTEISAGGGLGLMGKAVVNIKSEGNINRDAKKLNANISEDVNTKIGRDVYMKIEGDIVQLFIENEVQIVCKDKVNFIVEDDFYMLGEKDIKILSKGTLHLEGKNSVAVLSDNIVGTVTPITSLGGVVAGLVPVGVAIPPDEVEADAEFDEARLNQDAAAASSSSPKQQYLWQDGPSGDLWKPRSDTKPFAVSLSVDTSQHELYEALPTGELEEVTIQYQNLDNSITTWQVTRPVHKLGRLIERGKYNGVANGGRTHWVWSTTGDKFPQQMFLKIGSQEHLIVDAKERHIRL